MIINLLAGLAAGLVAALATFHGLPNWGRLLLATGLLGGFSTFSTAVNEVLALARQRRHLAALGYLGASILLPPVLTAFGFMNIDTKQTAFVIPSLLDFVKHPRSCRSFFPYQNDHGRLIFHLFVNPPCDRRRTASLNRFPVLMVQNLLTIKYAHILDKLNTIHITVVVKRIENCHLIPLCLLKSIRILLTLPNPNNTCIQDMARQRVMQVDKAESN